MKKNTHPVYHKEAKVSCACGHSFIVGSTLEEIKTELCSFLNRKKIRSIKKIETI
jgi:large subunit ribosomal protein L31